MITIATDAETKERVRRYAQAAGVDLTTYISAAISAAMLRDDQVARTFAPLDALIDEAEERDSELPWPTGATTGISPAESDSIDHALDDFFQHPHDRQGIA
ncbi:MAG: hypothetical protein JWL99_3930 [Streptomyces oryziradicis]|jgi:hypothetical protein|nr:hypothetical protein [Actinacidiphila oryziradicis]MDX6328401.1 hypothetical protein [Streptomycetaceae bacterium]